jgi:serine/threonine protein kinase
MIDDGGEQTAQADPTSQHDKPTLNQEKWKKMHADSIVGTYYYMAPEVLQGESYNATADW